MSTTRGSLNLGSSYLRNEEGLQLNNRLERTIETSSILSRAQAIALRATLAIDSSLYQEINRALILQIGMVTLTNGTKIYTIPETNRLRGGNPEECKALIVDLTCWQLVLGDSTRLSQVGRTKKEFLKSIFSSIDSHMRSLMEDGKEKTNRLKPRENRLSKSMFDNRKRYAEANSEKEKKDSELTKLNSNLANLQTKKTSLDTQIREATEEVTRLEQQVREEEQKQTDALTDLIPVVGILGGLITGRYHRMIPGHSTVSGLIANIKKDLENAQTRQRRKQQELSTLTGEIEALNPEITRKKEEKTALEGKLASLEQEKTLLDTQIKDMGRALTTLRNAILKLEELQIKMTSLNKKLRNTKILASVELVEKTHVDSFLEQVLQFQKDYFSIELYERNDVFSSIVRSLLCPCLGGLRERLGEDETSEWDARTIDVPPFDESQKKELSLARLSTVDPDSSGGRSWICWNRA